MLSHSKKVKVEAKETPGFLSTSALAYLFSPLEVPPIEKNATNRIEHDHEKNPLHHTRGRVSTDVVHATSDLQPLITADQGNQCRKERSLS